jgi:transcription elongation factor/antiterminator RfaH
MSDWYALYTRPRHEKRVFQELTNRQIEAFLPTQTFRRRWSDRYKLVEEPLFKNYLFINVNDDRLHHDALSPYGVVQLVTCDGKPARIAAHEIDSIRRLVASMLPYGPHPYLKIGQRVRVRSGPLEGCEGILTRRKGLSRLVLSVHLLQQSVSAEIDASCVQPA